MPLFTSAPEGRGASGESVLTLAPEGVETIGAPLFTFAPGEGETTEGWSSTMTGHGLTKDVPTEGVSCI